MERWAGRHFDISNDELIKAKKLMKELSIGHKIEAAFDQLSRGERQNVLIARALIAKPKLLILDEPETGLDIFAREYMLQTVQKLAEDNKITMIYVTHYPKEILPLFDQCVLMKNGTFEQMGKTSEVFTSENISRLIQHEISAEKGAYFIKNDGCFR